MDIFIKVKNGYIRVADAGASIGVTSREAEVSTREITKIIFTPASADKEGTLDIITKKSGNLRLRFDEDKNAEMQRVNKALETLRSPYVLRNKLLRLFAVVVAALFIFKIIVSLVLTSFSDTKTESYNYTWEKHYIIDEYEKYNSPSTENGLQGTLLKIIGVVDSCEDLEENGGFVYTVSDSPNMWLARAYTTSGEMPIQTGESVVLYGEYQGVSENYDNIPVILVTRLVVRGDIYEAAINEYGASIAEYIENKAAYDMYAELDNSPLESLDTTATTGQLNALETAKQYLDFMSFSHDGLMEQLEYEGYRRDEIAYAVSRCGADWNEQAVKKAKEYLDSMSFSKEELIEQLVYEGFTNAEASYGASKNGY